MKDNSKKLRLMSQQLVELRLYILLMFSIKQRSVSTIFNAEEVLQQIQSLHDVFNFYEQMQMVNSQET